MERADTALEGVCILQPRVFSDRRGFFLESYNQRYAQQVRRYRDSRRAASTPHDATH